MSVHVSGGWFQWMWLAFVHASSGFLVLLFLPEDEGTAFLPWKAAAGVVPLGIFGAVCPSHGADASSCTCGRAGNSREWPQNSAHRNDYTAGTNCWSLPQDPSAQKLWRGWNVWLRSLSGQESPAPGHSPAPLDLGCCWMGLRHMGEAQSLFSGELPWCRISLHSRGVLGH